MGEWRHIFTILILDAGWKTVASFTLLQLYARRVTGTIWIGCTVGTRTSITTRIIFPLPEIEPQPPCS
jgi:hypothetical protein